MRGDPLFPCNAVPMHPRLHRVAIYSADVQQVFSRGQSAAKRTEIDGDCQLSDAADAADAVAEQEAGGQKLPCMFGNLHVRRRGDAAAAKNVISSAIQLLPSNAMWWCWCCYLDSN